MSERSVSIIAGGAAFHPVSHYQSPADLLNDTKLSRAEKRLILSSWASDMYAVESQPALRKIPGIARPLYLADLLGALRQLDREDQPPRPRGGAAMRVVPRVDVNADGGAAPAAALTTGGARYPDAPGRPLAVFPRGQCAALSRAACNAPRRS